MSADAYEAEEEETRVAPARAERAPDHAYQQSTSSMVSG